MITLLASSTNASFPVSKPVAPPLPPAHPPPQRGQRPRMPPLYPPITRRPTGRSDVVLEGLSRDNIVAANAAFHTHTRWMIEHGGELIGVVWKPKRHGDPNIIRPVPDA